MTAVSCSYISIGGNRNPAAADWSPSGLLAFGAGRCISLWNPLDPEYRGVFSTLKGHTDRVNVVRFLPGQSLEKDIIISGSVDQSLRIWRRLENSDSFSLCSVVEGVHKASVNAIATCPRLPSVFASASADGIVAIFSLSSLSEGTLDVKLLQMFSTAPKFYPLAVALSALPSSSSSSSPALVLAVSGSASSVSIYLASSPSSQFSHQATLSGHENWIRCLTFTPEDHSKPESDLILASASQDKYIRLWRIHPGEELPAAAAVGESKTFGLSNRLSNKAHKLRAEGDKVWSVTFEALLMGHEDWIFTAVWRPQTADESGLRLLSTSADNSLSVWAPEESSGIWLTTSRLGEISDHKGASTATGSAGGLWMGLWSPDGKAVVALGKTGSWRLWKHNSQDDRWVQSVGIGGHVKEVMGCSWGKAGGYLLSTGLDQTTRLSAEWIRKNESRSSWHEFSRPQIHGYDINCIASLGGNKFVSGADEKLLRVFDEPKTIAGLLESLCSIKELSKESMPDAANVPVLGLSNKAVDDSTVLPLPNGSAPEEVDDENEVSEAPAQSTTSIIENLNHPPLEDHLARHTLWPEREKLYGHGYEISALSCSPDGKLIATACKASSIDHAVIRLFETETWREIKPPLKSHSLTVHGMAFSPDGSRLLSVGRDRAWTVFEKRGAGWEVLDMKEKGHTRVIWDGKWAPVEDVFATASRDKSVKLWQREDSGWVSKATLKFEAPITALDFLGEVIDGKCWLAIGLEDGGLYVYCVKVGDWPNMELFVKLDDRITPDKSVTQITWRPTEGQLGKKEMAVSSEDFSVRVYSISIA
ncbi:WD40 repeat-like protein [Choiromyces venosus 120613-1]|uniref:Elongator complex protein 2 n=1 Tax=Choiromyces venosus 120613-1 TaxID=1336337 RepID=A0A3N4JP86_9PEZI|nr:WD40 repeat-like protein [Choiromyces venosus 120613-1]